MAPARRRRLRSIFGLTNITAGEIRLAGEKVSGLKPHQFVRKGLSYVPQDHSIFPSLSVIDNLRWGPSPCRRSSSRPCSIWSTSGFRS